MNECIVANETAPIPLLQDPGQSSSEKRADDDSSPKKLALHQQPKDKEETHENKIFNSKDHKVLIQDIVNGDKTGPAVKRQTLGSPPPTSITVSSLRISSNNNKKNSLNEAFREYRNSVSNDQENHPNKQPNRKGRLGSRFVSNISKIRNRRKMFRKEKMMEQKNEGETKNSVGSASGVRSEKSHADPQESKTQNSTSQKHPKGERRIVKAVVKDFSSEGDQKILRAIQRSAVVNAAVLATSLTGGVSGAAGLLTGSAIAAKRLGDGVKQDDEREVAKSLAVYGSSTTASFVGQVATGALLVGVAGTTLPVAGAVAFGVGCASGITAGALSEWGVDHALQKQQQQQQGGQDEDEEEEEQTGDETVSGLEQGATIVNSEAIFEC